MPVKLVRKGEEGARRSGSGGGGLGRGWRWAGE